MQLTTDALKAYLDAVEDAFVGDIDYAKLKKLYGPGPESAGRYSPAECIDTRKERMMVGCGAIAMEAVQRFGSSAPVAGSTLMWVGAQEKMDMLS